MLVCGIYYIKAFFGEVDSIDDEWSAVMGGVADVSRAVGHAGAPEISGWFPKRSVAVHKSYPKIFGLRPPSVASKGSWFFLVSSVRSGSGVSY